MKRYIMDTHSLEEYRPITPEDDLIRKEEDHAKCICYVYDLLSCLTLNDIKVLCLRGGIPPFKFLEPDKIRYKVYGFTKKDHQK